MSKHPVFVRTGKGDFYEGIDFRYQAYWAAQGQQVAGSPALQLARDGRLGSRLIATDYNNFAPRLGHRVQPVGRLVVRAGFGIFFSQESKNSIFDLNRGLGGRTGRMPDNTYSAPNFGYTNFINTSALPVTLPVGLTWGADYHLPHHVQHDVPVQRAALAGQINRRSRPGTADRRAGTRRT